MQTGGVRVAVHQRGGEPDRAVCSCVAQVDRAFDPAVDDVDGPDELRVCKIDIPHDPGAGDPDSRERHRLPPWRPRQQVLEKAGGELAAIVTPACVILFLGIERRRYAATVVELGYVATLDPGPSPALGGRDVVVASS